MDRECVRQDLDPVQPETQPYRGTFQPLLSHTIYDLPLLEQIAPIFTPQTLTIITLLLILVFLCLG